MNSILFLLAKFEREFMLEEDEPKIERKGSLEIIEGIFEALNDHKVHTISDLSHQIKAHWKTVKKKIEIIQKIQNLPQIEVLEGSKQIYIRLK